MSNAVPRVACCPPLLAAGVAAMLCHLPLLWSVARAEGTLSTRPSSSWSQRLGQPQARLLAKYCNQNVIAKLQRDIPAASDELVAPLRAALAAFVKADDQARTKPMKKAVENHVVGLSQVTAALLADSTGLRVRNEPVTGSQRGTLARVVVEDRTGNHGFAVIAGSKLTSVTLAGDPWLGTSKTYGLGIDGAKITRLLNPQGTVQVSESSLPDKRIVYTYDKFTVDESNRPTRWKCSKCFVDQNGSPQKTRFTFKFIESGPQDNAIIEQSIMRQLYDVNVSLPR